MLLGEGGNVSIAADDGLTPLLLSAQCDHFEVSNLMLGQVHTQTRRSLTVTHPSLP